TVPRPRLLSRGCSACRELRSSPTRRSSDLVEASGRSGRAECGLERAREERLRVGKRQCHRFGCCGPAPLTDTARTGRALAIIRRSEEHTSELQSRENLVCRLLLEKKKKRRR